MAVPMGASRGASAHGQPGTPPSFAGLLAVLKSIFWLLAPSLLAGVLAARKLSLQGPFGAGLVEAPVPGLALEVRGVGGAGGASASVPAGPVDVLIFHGAVTRMSPRRQGKPTPFGGGLNALYNNSDGDLMSLLPVHYFFSRHVLDKNPGMEVILHSWNPELEKNFTELFHPVRAQYENNTLYNQQFKRAPRGSDYNLVSKIFSMSRSVELMIQQEVVRGSQYRMVLLTRPDIVIFRDLFMDEKVNSVAPLEVLVDSQCANTKNADLVFLMHRDAAAKHFRKLYASLSPSLPATIKLHKHVGMQCHPAQQSTFNRYVHSNMKGKITVYNFSVMLPRRVGSYANMCRYILSKGFLTLDQQRAMGLPCTYNKSDPRGKYRFEYIYEGRIPRHRRRARRMLRAR